MGRVIDRNGNTLIRTNLCGEPLRKWWAEERGLGYCKTTDNIMVTCSGSCVLDFGNLKDEPNRDAALLIELAAHRFNYLDMWNVKPYVIVNELDGDTIIFTEYE